MSEPTDWNQPPYIKVPPPGPRSRRLAERLARVESRNVTFLTDDFPIFWEKSRGSNVWDADGNRYVDLSGGFGVAVAGHRNRTVMQSIRRQIGRLPHGMDDVHPPALKVKLLEALAGVSPIPDSRIVLTCSGAEAVEVALKTARLATGRYQQAADTHIAVVGLNIASLHVKISETQPGHDGLGELSTIDGYAVGFAIDVIKEVGIIVFWKVQIVLQVIFRTPQVLDADKVCVLLFQPVVKSFFRSRFNAVGTETDDPHS